MAVTVTAESMVLILVVVEDSLGGENSSTKLPVFTQVLILVVVEDSLGDGLISARAIGGRGLNPCCCGR